MITPAEYDYLEKRWAEVHRELQAIQKKEKALCKELNAIEKKLKEPIDNSGKV
jgi:predicted transcriptional regulator